MPSQERALFRLFNDAAELRTRLIFAAAAAPRQSGWSLEDWRSRAAACVVYQIRELDDEGRIEALRLRAAQRGLQLPYDTSEYLLKRMPRDLPSLFEILDELDEASLEAQRRLTIPFIREALEKRARTKS
jgi:DnaA-homolog protein